MEASAAELEELSKKSFKENTQYATRNAVSIYKKFCEQLGIQSDLKKMTKLTLAKILKKCMQGQKARRRTLQTNSLQCNALGHFKTRFGRNWLGHN